MIDLTPDSYSLLQLTQIEDLETKIRDCDSRLQVIDDTIRLKELQEAER